MLTKNRIVLALLVGLVCLTINTTLSNANNSNSTSEPVIAGSKTYLVTATIWSDGSLDFGSFEQVTRTNLRDLIDQFLERVNDQTEQQKDLAVTLQTLQIRVSRIKAELRKIKIKREQAGEPEEELGEEAPEDRFEPGQCRAQTTKGRRCKNTTKGSTGRCWLHQRHAIVYQD